MRARCRTSAFVPTTLARASARTRTITATPQYPAPTTGTARRSRASACTIGNWRSTAITAEIA